MMCKKFFCLTKLYVLLLIMKVMQNIQCLTVDNQLVSARNDCFERIALEAMLPFEKAFQTEDTNSLKMCKDKCKQFGEQCQTLAFGVHRRGNGTCQLSSEKFPPSTGRPSGILFDPDFDLYMRKTNCFDLNDESFTIPETTVTNSHTTYTTSGISHQTRLPNKQIETNNTPLLVVHPSPSTYNDYNDPTYTTPVNSHTTTFSSVDTPISTITTATGGDRLYFTHDIYPLYKYPMLYEHNYPAPNEDTYIPGGYAAHVQPLDDRYRPPYSSDVIPRPTHSPPPKPVFGLGYGNSYSYGTPETYTQSTRNPYSSETQQNANQHSFTSRPNSYTSARPSEYMNMPHGPQNEQNLSNQYQPGPLPPTHPNDVSNRPDPLPKPPLLSNGFEKPNSFYFSKRNDSGFNYDDKTITTFFNPEDYMENKKPSFAIRDRFGHPVNNLHACFRRVLAGKRIAPQWVRRTLACERVEDCMTECGSEKRFMCEGFNFRIDPSANGQGDCELIEVPLAEIDLYSNPRQREQNLLRHSDYDYYERDRNAPSSCRKSVCKECSFGKPQWDDGSFTFPSSNSGYGGELFHYHSSSDRPSNQKRPPLIASPLPSPLSLDHRYPQKPNHQSIESYSNSYEHSSYGSSYSGSISPSYYDSSSTGESYIDRLDSIKPDHRQYRPIPEHMDHPRRQFRPYSRYPIQRPIKENFLDRDHFNSHKNTFIPYIIDHQSYGTQYGGTHRKQSAYWGLDVNPPGKDSSRFNYFELGPYKQSKTRLTYPGSSYDSDIKGDRPDYRHQWTRRPGLDECSAKIGEGFRLHNAAIKHSYSVPTLTECERLCSSEKPGFICQTYSYRYSHGDRDNCMLCDRAVNHLDYYVDIEPDRDYDIYSMADDMEMCRKNSHHDINTPTTALSDPRKTQCFFRAIDATRFFKSIVRDSLTVRSVGECEMECIKSAKFTCRAFAYRYGQQRHAGVIDNCQLSDWPVRDMDKQRHLILDASFDIFERASYGKGCEIQPIVDDKNKKLCYLGYGSPAKFLPAAIKKVISTQTELQCKKECIRLRETTSFKCYSFSYGPNVNSYNCEMSDLDQSELKLNVHFTHTTNRDYWLFAWNPFDWTCRDKTNTIGGSRLNNNRRMDVFSEPGDSTWRHYSVSGKPCNRNSPCEKNLITGFYSCEIEGGEIGSWDYCCKVDHPCGYSKGFDYPWCFVGDESDQWRKCSDRYYPNKKYSHQNLPVSNLYSPKQTSSSSQQSNEYQKPPKPGGLQNLNDFAAARLWPVTYLYSEGPPNSTELTNFVDCNKDKC